MNKSKFRKNFLAEFWRGNLEEYTSALHWSKQGLLVATSAEGMVIYYEMGKQPKILLTPPETNYQGIQSADFSADGDYVAVGAQDGKVRVWRLNPEIELISTLEYPKKWIEHLAWHPQQPLLAFSFGYYVQVWDLKTEAVITTLSLGDASVLGLQWHPTGAYLAVGANGGIGIWESDNWDEDPFWAEVAGACQQIAWSPDGLYLAGNSLDNSVWLWSWENLETWHLSGFGSKIRDLSWSTLKDDSAPLLAICCLDTVIMWRKAPSDDQGWYSFPHQEHNGIVENLAFHPQNFSFVSLDDEGVLIFWSENHQPMEKLTIFKEGGGALVAWHPTGQYLAVGSKTGEVAVIGWVEESK